jgi:hypothetical protein
MEQIGRVATDALNSTSPSSRFSAVTGDISLIPPVATSLASTAINWRTDLPVPMINVLEAAADEYALELQGETESDKISRRCALLNIVARLKVRDRFNAALAEKAGAKLMPECCVLELDDAEMEALNGMR